MNKPQTNQPRNIIVRPEQTKERCCLHCGNQTFDQVTFIREVPAILTGSLRPEAAFMPAFECRRCRKIFDFDAKTVEKSMNLLRRALDFIRELKNILRK